VQSRGVRREEELGRGGGEKDTRAEGEERVEKCRGVE
jgi:hypothetical protein